MSQPKTLRPVFANRGIETAYRKELQSLIDDMHRSAVYWLTAAYRKTPPRMAALAGDASPSANMQKAIQSLSSAWKTRFSERARDIAKKFSDKNFRYTEKSLAAALKEVGWTVDFKMTRTMQDALTAHIEENINLIKSIPDQYFDRVQSTVMQGYTRGRDLESIVKGLQEIYPITAKRAAHIALDQCNKANAVVNQARQLELGFEEAIWLHSHAGKQPRASHLAANGKTFKIAEGMYLDGKFVQPGEEINCRCSSRVILPLER